MNATIRLLRKRDIPAARKIVSKAFGTFLGARDPDNFRTDVDHVGTRLRTDPGGAFAAELDGEVVGSNFAVRWGSVGFFGPLTVRPDLWDSGLGKKLVAAAVDRLDAWGTTHTGLFTFPQSAKHIGLYSRFGFWPRFLTAIMAKAVEQRDPKGDWQGFSTLPEPRQAACLHQLGAVTEALYPGLRLDLEIRSVADRGLGETVLIDDGHGPEGFAVCHCGAGTEAGTDRLYIKFAAVRPGPAAGAYFARLLEACAGLAAANGAAHIDAGMNLARKEAMGVMLDQGFRTVFQGVAMHRPNEPGYSREGLYVIDDWR